jgi:hypothetical protein
VPGTSELAIRYTSAAGLQVGVTSDALARDFPDMHDMEVKNAIECLAREYGKLGEPWMFVSRQTPQGKLAVNAPSLSTA